MPSVGLQSLPRSAPNKPPGPPVREQPDRPLLISLDPGHGGEDPGATGPRGTREKDIVLLIGHVLKKMIDAQPNMRAYMTRDKDYFVPFHVRVQNARRVKADLFVPLHADAWIKPSARGSSDRKSTRLNSSHLSAPRMPSSA